MGDTLPTVSIDTALKKGANIEDDPDNGSVLQHPPSPVVPVQTSDALHVGNLALTIIFRNLVSILHDRHQDYTLASLSAACWSMHEYIAPKLFKDITVRTDAQLYHVLGVSPSKCTTGRGGIVSAPNPTPTSHTPVHRVSLRACVESVTIRSPLDFCFACPPPATTCSAAGGGGEDTYCMSDLARSSSSLDLAPFPNLKAVSVGPFDKTDKKSVSRGLCNYTNLHKTIKTLGTISRLRVRCGPTLQFQLLSSALVNGLFLNDKSQGIKRNITDNLDHNSDNSLKNVRTMNYNLLSMIPLAGPWCYPVTHLVVVKCFHLDPQRIHWMAQFDLLPPRPIEKDRELLPSSKCPICNHGDNGKGYDTEPAQINVIP